MKQLISLLLITLVTVISWSTCAENKGINETTNYGLSYLVASSSLLTPTLTTPETDNNLRFSQTKIVNEHNRFFELSIIFNEKLQQMISLLTHSDDEKVNVANNNVLSSPNEQLAIEACKES